MKTKFSGYRIAAAAFVWLFIAMGALSGLAVFMPSICAENGFTVPQVSIMFTCAGLTGALSGMFIMPTALKRIAPKGCIFLSYLILIGHMLWYSFATHLWELYVAACIGGVAVGMGTMAAAGALVANWFIDKRAQMTGIVMAGAGFGGAVLQAVSGALIDAVGYRMTYRIIVAAIAVIGAVVLVIIHNRPEDVGEKPLGYDNVSKGGAAEQVELPGVTAKEAIKTPSFWMAFAGIALGTLAYMSYMSYVVTLLTSEGYGLATGRASVYSAVLGLAGAVYMLVNGRLVEKLGFTKYVLFGGMIGIVGALIFGCSGTALANMSWLILIAVVLMSFANSRQTADAQTATAACFGLKDFNSIQAYFAAAANLGSMFMAFVVGGLLGAGFSLANCYVAFAAISAASMILLFLAGKLSPLNKAKRA